MVQHVTDMFMIEVYLDEHLPKKLVMYAMMHLKKPGFQQLIKLERMNEYFF
jgi:hypothetical protein